MIDRQFGSEAEIIQDRLKIIKNSSSKKSSNNLKINQSNLTNDSMQKTPRIDNFMSMDDDNQISLRKQN